MIEPEPKPSGSQAQQIDAIYQQGLDAYYQHPDQAEQLFEQAITLAQTGEFTDRPYREGLTASLAALAALHMETKPDLAARYCLQVLSLLEGYPVIPPLIKAKNCLGWIYFHLGDYSTAMEWALQGLQHSQERNLPNTEATAFDLIANIHATVNEFPQALRAHQAALHIARTINHKPLEAKNLNNIAMTQVAMGDFETALETSLNCLSMFQELNSILDIANCYDTMAQIYLGMGDYLQAETNLLKGLQIIEPIENQVLNTYLLKSLGRVYLAQDDLPKAIDQLEKALAIAQKNGYRGEQAECHQLLAAVHERQSDHLRALQHFKLFYEINKEIAGDAATKRLAILNVTHAVENAKHDAEIYRLRNIELQSEIDERKRIQGVLEELATRDPLTSLFNRRYFLEKSEQEFERAIRYHHPMAVIMLDLDHFKQVNDTYGHPVGDQVLAMVAKRLKEFMRIVDIAGRMGGEEFAMVLPETGLSGASQAAARLCDLFSSEAFVIKTYTIRVTASIGVTCFVPAEGSDPPAFDTLLQQADQALYMAKNAGRSQVQVFSPK